MREVGRPLDGVKVVELAHVASGPFAGMLLADLGADVVKIEAPTGDQLRSWPPLARSEHEEFSHNFASLNRNKRSVVADLKTEEGRNLARELCLRADVIIENFRPGVLPRFGLDFDSLAESHSGLVYCSISGYGANSPYAGRGAYDVVIQGASGLMSVTGEEGGAAVKAGVPVVDFATGLYAAYTIAAVLPGVRERRESVWLDCPMLDCTIAISALQTSEYWGSGVAPGRLGSAHPRNAPYQAYEAADKPFIIAAGTDQLWEAVCEVIEDDELAADPRFQSQEGRAQHHRVLASLLNEHFARANAEWWMRRLDDRGVPCGPLNTFEEMLGDPHVEMTGLVQSLDIPVAGPTPTVVYPVRISGASPRLDRSPPALGGDLAEVCHDWGVN